MARDDDGGRMQLHRSEIGTGMVHLGRMTSQQATAERACIRPGPTVDPITAYSCRHIFHDAITSVAASTRSRSEPETTPRSWPPTKVPRTDPAATAMTDAWLSASRRIQNLQHY